MKHFFTISLCFLALSLSAQDDCQGPDFNNDGEIGSSDLIVFLSFYGNEWPIVPEFNCGETITHQDYAYQTVEIGEQCWFAENCRYLPSVSPTSSNSSSDDPYFYVYGYEGTDVATAQSQSTYNTYGALYNWPAVMTEGICPSGWHIPSDGEWMELEMSLGMSEAVANYTSYRGSPVATYMKSSTSWNGTNSSGFNGLPGGYSYSGGSIGSGNNAYWWSSSASGSSDSWIRHLFGLDGGNVFRDINSRFNGFSARCVRD